MKSVVIDTNALLRLILNDIPQQKKMTEELLKKAMSNEIKVCVAQTVIFEIDFILKKYYEFKKETVIEYLKSLVTTPYLEVESSEIFRMTLSFYEKEEISFVDCFLLSKAKIEKADLFTFDKKLKNLIKTSS